MTGKMSAPSTWMAGAARDRVPAGQGTPALGHLAQRGAPTRRRLHRRAGRAVRHRQRVGHSARIPSGLSGQFILKVQLAAGGSQAAAHAAFRQALPDFAASHVPELVLSASGVGVTADVYDIAGYSLDSLRSAEHVTDYADREESCVLVARDLLTEQLLTTGQPDYTPTGASVLRDWLGTDFPDNRRGEQVRAVLRGLTQGSRAFRHEGELLPNPLALFDMSAGPCADTLPSLRGSAHGDLHLRNIMVRGSLLSRNLAYWLIDVHWAARAPLLYDHAYLEVAALLDGLRRSGSGLSERLINRLVGGPVNSSGVRRPWRGRSYAWRRSARVR